MKYIYFVLILIACFMGAGCERADEDDSAMIMNQEIIVACALKEEPLLGAFNNRYPKSVHFISYISGKDGQTTWNSKSPLFDRYVLQMRVAATIDRKTLKVQLRGEPSFQIKEVAEIAALPDGRQEVHYGKTFTFSAADWKRLEAAAGDFEVLGIALTKDKPVVGFSDYSTY